MVNPLDIRRDTYICKFKQPRLFTVNDLQEQMGLFE